MWLYLIRHAEAVPMGGGIRRDFDRPLTEAGRRDAQALARSLQRRSFPVDAIVTSPLVRAYQTAEEIAAILLAGSRPLTCDELSGEQWRPAKLSRVLAEAAVMGPRQPSRSDKAVAAVGHMPHLAHYLDWLLGLERSPLSLAKAAIACVRCDAEPRRGGGELVWLVTPVWYD